LLEHIGVFDLFPGSEAEGAARASFSLSRLFLSLTFYVVLLGTSLVVIRLALRFGRLLFGNFGRLVGRGRTPRRPRGSSSEIYGRLERVLARHGYRRAEGQTPYEFALVAGGELAERPGCNPLAALPRRIVEAFYRVRFGHHPHSAEAQAVEQALSTLERGLAQASAGG
jgi:hypothetical protein